MNIINNFKNFKTISVVFMLFFIVSTIPGCSRNEDLNETTTINIGLMADQASVPFIIATEMGYFEKYNVDLNSFVFFSALERDSAMQSNQLNAVSTDIISAGFYREQSTDYTITSFTDGTFGIHSYKYDSFDSMKSDIISNNAHPSIGLSTNTLMDFITDYILFSEDIDLDSVEKVNIASIPNRLEMLSSDNIDLASLPEPFIGILNSSGSNLLGTISDYDLNPGVLMVETNLANDKETMNNFYLAYNDAVEYINNTPIDEYYPLLIEALGFPEDQTGLASYSLAASPDLRDIDEAISWLYDNGLIENKWTYDDLVTNLF